jgi:hypothetical protein
VTESIISNFHGSVISRRSNWDRQLAVILVVPTPIPVDYRSEHRATPPLLHGISVRGDEIFIDGKPVIRERTPCFLIFDPKAWTFVEVPIANKNSLLTDKLNVDDLPEWQRDIVPILRRLEPRAEAASTAP